MRFTGILILLFLFPFSILAGTFIETFDHKNLDDWRELVELNNPPGLWEILNGELEVVHREPSLYFFITGDETWVDYTVEFDVKPLKKHGIGSIVIASRIKGTWVVACRIADPVVIVDGKAVPGGEKVFCSAGGLHDGIFISLHVEDHPLLRLNKWSHLKLSVHGNTAAFWINEKQVMVPTEIPNLKGVQHPEFNFDAFPDFLTGGVGFGLANYTARFDNITITGDSIPNRGGLAVTSRGKLAMTWGDLKRF